MPNPNYDDAQTGGVMLDTLNLMLLLDNSYSMEGSRIAQVNNAIPTLKNVLLDIEKEYKVKILLRIVAFSDQAVWKVGSVEQGVPVADFSWEDLKVVGGTRTDLAVLEAEKVHHRKNLTAKENTQILRPVVILLTDGYCNPSNHADYLSAIAELKKCLTGGNPEKDKITRVAIGVKDYNESELVEFASPARIKDAGQQTPSTPLVFPVKDVESLGKLIEWLIPQSVISSIVHNANPNTDPNVIEFPTPPADIIGDGTIL